MKKQKLFATGYSIVPGVQVVAESKKPTVNPSVINAVRNLQHQVDAVAQVAMAGTDPTQQTMASVEETTANTAVNTANDSEPTEPETNTNAAGQNTGNDGIEEPEIPDVEPEPPANDEWTIGGVTLKKFYWCVMVGALVVMGIVWYSKRH